LKIVNYENEFWPIVYDTYNRHLRHKLERDFYFNQFKKAKGPILELACGTGLILLDLMEKGIDGYGFDISGAMLETFYEKAQKAGFSDIKRRATVKDMVNFRYNKKFSGAYITARSFLHCVTLEDQVSCLKNIYKHLEPGGRFITNLFTPDNELLMQYAKPNQKFEYYETYKHPETGKDIDLYLKQEHDLDNQLQHLTWRFKYKNRNHDSKMLVCWIHKSQFELLLKHAGFKKWKLYGGFKKAEYKYGDEMVFVAEK
jgi:SAM-dependent methyltransferase